VALGGYQGWDKILTLAQLKLQVANGTVRYFLLFNSGTSTRSPGGNLPGGVDAGLSTVNQGLETWVTSTCMVAPTSTYASKSNATTAQRGGFGSQGAGQLYDCGALKMGAKSGSTLTARTVIVGAMPAPPSGSTPPGQ
jgi:hypothetical protein